MQKMFLRRKFAQKLQDKMLPNIIKDLNSRRRGLKYMWRYSHKDGGQHGEMLGEVEGCGTETATRGGEWEPVKIS